MKKCLFILFLSLSIFVSSLPVSIASNVIDKQILLKINEYEKLLEKKSKNNPEALKTRKQFFELTIEKKKKFLKYINDPKIIKEIFESLEKLSNNTTLKLYNGDIEIQSSQQNIIEKVEEPDKNYSLFSDITDLFIGTTFAAKLDKSTKFTRRVTESARIRILGLTFIYMQGFIRYISQSVSVIEIKESRAIWDLNFTIANADLVLKDHNIERRRAHLLAEWQVSIPIIHGSVTRISLFRKRLHVIGDHQGNSTKVISTI